MLQVFAIINVVSTKKQQNCNIQVSGSNAELDFIIQILKMPSDYDNDNDIALYKPIFR